MTLAADSRPALWRLARLGFDDVRGTPILLYPEGALVLNYTGAAILELCDGSHTLAEICDTLGARYGADVTDDVTHYLDRLVDRELVRVA